MAENAQNCYKRCMEVVVIIITKRGPMNKLFEFLAS